jgi:mRNA interferase RelE/StbE
MWGDKGSFRLIYAPRFVKRMDKLDKKVAADIGQWLDKNLKGTTNPRLTGKALTDDWRGHWRWRVGDYRIIGVIKDRELVILCLEVGHRKEVYG